MVPTPAAAPTFFPSALPVIHPGPLIGRIRIRSDSLTAPLYLGGSAAFNKKDQMSGCLKTTFLQAEALTFTAEMSDGDMHYLVRCTRVGTT